MLTLTFHGHACFVIEGDGKRLIVDPFLTGNPKADVPADRLPPLDAILLSHGHGDHLGDAVALSKRHGATIVAPCERSSSCSPTP
jgi:L-ascorbate metabolism protein UlaG (beta-lactamase superfamily)